MKKVGLKKIHELLFCLALVLGLFIIGIVTQCSKASFGDGKVDVFADGGGTAGQLARTEFKMDGTAGQH